MKRAAFLFLPLLLLYHCSQSQKIRKDFAVRKVVFSLEFSNKGEGVTMLSLYKKLSTDTTKFKNIIDTLYINGIDKSSFMIGVATLIDSLATDTTHGKMFLSDNKSDLEIILIQKYEEIQSSIQTSQVEFGKDEYYGLTNDEINSLLEKQEAYRKLRRDYFTIKKAQKNLPKRLIKTKFQQEYLRQNLIQESETNKDIVQFDTDMSKKYSDSLDLYRRKYFELAKVDDSYDSLIKDKFIKLKILKTEIRALNRNRKYTASLIGNANVVSSFKTVSGTQLSAGFGILARKPSKAEFIGILTVAQTSDTISGSGAGDFGPSILVPGVRRFSLLLSYRQNSIFPLSSSFFFQRIGFAFNANVTPYRWVIPKTAGGDSIATKILPTSFDLMVPYNWLSIYEDGKDISISTDVGLSLRWLFGDATTKNRKAFIGNAADAYFGLIGGLSIRYNGLRAQFHVPILFNKTKVEGLTGGQVIASIGFVGSILNDVSTVLKKKNNK